MHFLELLPFLLLTCSGVLCRHQQESFLPGTLPEFDNAEGQVAANGAVPNSGGTPMPAEEAALQREPEVITKPEEGKQAIFPFSDEKLKKMLEKAVLKIIMGDLSNADLNLLKSLNYSYDDVMAIRAREMEKKHEDIDFSEENNNFMSKQQELKNFDFSKDRMEVDYDNLKLKNELTSEEQVQDHTTFDYDSYNNQAVLDYENAAKEQEFKESPEEALIFDYRDPVQTTSDSEENIQQTFDQLMEPHVIFKVRYDDSDLNSESVEKPDFDQRKGNRSPHANTDSTFLEASTPVQHPYPLVYQLGGVDAHRNHLVATMEAPQELDRVPEGPSVDLEENHQYGTSTTTVVPSSTLAEIIPSMTPNQVNLNPTTSANTANVDSNKRATTVQPSPNGEIYKGLEWVGDDVYRVIPEALDHEATDYLDQITDPPQDNWVATADSNMQNDPPIQLVTANANASTAAIPNANLTTYQAIRKDGNLFTITPDRQGQKAMEEIKMKVLVMTGRFNSTSNNSPVQREKLTMFPPKCEIPRNTDPETWADQFSMNMYFQHNLTSKEHVVAAKLRLYKLPQENVTTSNAANFEGEEEDERKIRISVYFYTKSLKKHRSKKRLMDSVVTPLTSTGSQMALDVRQSLRFWRLNPRNGNVNGNNHGLVVLVEDQDGKPLKPSLYIQSTSCHTTGQNQDDKAYQRVPALFVRACTRYIRFVEGKKIIYVDCSKQHDH